MQRKLQPTVLNPISLLGAVIAVFSLVIILVLLALGATGTLANPYTGILTFMLGPGALVLGLIMIPIGAMKERHRLARLGVVAKAFPILDLNDPRQRRGLTIFAGLTAGVMALMAVTTWGAAEFMESKEFCGDLCHRVMQPEGAAYTASPHARVKCVSCHIGPGAPWLVKSKISGLRQVFNYTFDLYPRPMDVPIKDLRPSRDTCEQCHWPDRFYGDQLRTIVQFGQDEKNMARSQPLVFRVGGSAQGVGIHWHTTAKVWYLPLNDARTEVGWVRVEKSDGSVDEYVLPDKKDQVTPEHIQSDQRFMDCIDCHNRAAHNFPPIEDSVDEAMARGTIDPGIPLIKQQVMKAIGNVVVPVREAQYQETLSRIGTIEDYYRAQQPLVYSGRSAQIRGAAAEAKAIYERSVFPDMKVAPGTYPDWLGHDGCTRCHGKLVGTIGAAAGKTVSSSCLTCHYPAPSVPSPPGVTSGGPSTPPLPANAILPAAIPHTLAGRDACNSCHAVGGAGVEVAGGTGLPADHKGRGEPTCIGCHALAQSPAAQVAAAPRPPVSSSGAQPSQPASGAISLKVSGPPPVPHPTQGREQCATCHTPGATGVGVPGGTGIPESHQGRADSTCLDCHAGAQSAASAATPTAQPTAMALTAPTAAASPAPAGSPTAAPAAVPTPPPTAAAPAGAPAVASGPPALPHTTQGRNQCTACHVVGAPGVGTPGGTGMPANHQGRADATCLGCHKS